MTAQPKAPEQEECNRRKKCPIVEEREALKNGEAVLFSHVLGEWLIPV